MVSISCRRPLASLAGCRLGTRKGLDSNSKPQYFESSVTPCSSGTEAVAMEGRRMSAGKVWSKALFDTGYFEGSKILGNAWEISRSAGKMACPMKSELGFFAPRFFSRLKEKSHGRDQFL